MRPENDKLDKNKALIKDLRYQINSIEWCLSKVMSKLSGSGPWSHRLNGLWEMWFLKFWNVYRIVFINVALDKRNHSIVDKKNHYVLQVLSRNGLGMSCDFFYLMLHL